MEEANFFILCGIISFLIYLLSDYFEFKGREFNFKSGNILGFISQILFLISVLGLIIFSPKWQIPLPLRIISFFLFILNLILIIRSLFLEVSFYKKEVGKLVKDGSYKLSRHPGVLWLLFLMIFLSLTVGSKYLFFGAFIFFLFNIIVALFEDKIFLPSKFSEYEDYKKKVPFLIPNLRELFRFLFNDLWNNFRYTR